MSTSSMADILGKLQTEHKINATFSYEELQRLKVDNYNNTEGNLNEFDGYNCKICKNKGFIAKLDDKGCEVYRECKCRKTRETLRRAKRSGLGDILSDFTFDKFIDNEDWQKKIKSQAIAFCEDDKAKWFYIGGQVGSGKSMICTAICGHYIKAGREVRYMLWCEEAKRLKALVNEPSYHTVIDKYKNADVLYIDDFLKTQSGEQPTKGDINLAFEIINRRLLSHEKITIISSEKTLDEILEYDEGTMSRVYQKADNYNMSIGKDRSKNYRLRNMV